jgi:hypothetical protein
MLQNWLKTIPSSLAKLAESLPDTTLGKNILLYRNEMPDLKKVRIAIIGVGEKEANAVREQLYRCAFSFRQAPSPTSEICVKPRLPC